MRSTEHFSIELFSQGYVDGIENIAIFNSMNILHTNTHTTYILFTYIYTKAINSITKHHRNIVDCLELYIKKIKAFFSLAHIVRWRRGIRNIHYPEQRKEFYSRNVFEYTPLYPTIQKRVYLQLLLYFQYTRGAVQIFLCMRSAYSSIVHQTRKQFLFVCLYLLLYYREVHTYIYICFMCGT